MLEAQRLVQVGSSLSADGVQPSLRIPGYHRSLGNQWPGPEFVDAAKTPVYGLIERNQPSSSNLERRVGAPARAPAVMTTSIADAFGSAQKLGSL